MHSLPVSQWVEVKPLSLQDASLWSARCELVTQRGQTEDWERAEGRKDNQAPNVVRELGPPGGKPVPPAPP